MPSSPPEGRRLIVFLKAPRPGQVKTRLAAALGADRACDAYREMVGTLLEHLAGWPEVELRFTPDDAAGELEAWRQPGWTLRSQGPGDLGQRLERAVADALAGGGQRVVVIGSDCPDLTLQDIHQAWEALRTHDVVLGPAEDGGYWLIGLRQPQPLLFTGISWSTPRVLQQTLEQAGKTGLTHRLLRTLRDLDTPEDWARWQKGPR